ncbi:hypothetical protein [Streptomyces zingiberis]|uniref:Uncharacterized protein n=1 Tax=Streptomyces zingiberis TaxID=2053010 RepID=A0ABX1C524_9ACTN|nr:hypothetical protein [Streptomyces zingiberis]NJQ03022.1 hypothetical protein [Streptomyces zingiberis]
MSSFAKAKGFRKSRFGTYLSIGTTLFGVVSIWKQVRTARSENDALMLADAVASGAAVATGVAVLVRELRRADSDDILLG